MTRFLSLANLIVNVIVIIIIPKLLWETELELKTRDKEKKANKHEIVTLNLKILFSSLVLPEYFASCFLPREEQREG